MEEMGARVDMYDERSVKSAFDRAVIKFAPKLYSKKTSVYYKQILEQVKANDYKFILFIDCEMASIEDLQRIKNYFPSAKFCLHLWDSLANLKGVEEKLAFFDYVTTFDKGDAHRLSLHFRPLFFCDEYISKTKSTDYRYDLSFIGTIHSDRYFVIKKLLEQLDGNRFYRYSYLQSKFMYYLYKLIKKEFRNTKIGDFYFDMIQAEEIARITEESAAVLDIQHPDQTGLTMRTLEMVGMKKKFVTTNRSIKEYDFYDANNIMIIDRGAPVLEKDFFKREYVDIPDTVYNKYYIETWIREVIGLDG